MSKTFKYLRKETYTQAELDELLNQHASYVAKGKVDASQFDELKGKYNDQRKSLYQAKVKSIASKYIDPKKLDDAIKIADLKFDEEQSTIDERAIDKTIKSLAKTKAYLAKNSSVDDAPTNANVDTTSNDPNNDKNIIVENIDKQPIKLNPRRNY